MPTLWRRSGDNSGRRLQADAGLRLLRLRLENRLLRGLAADGAWRPENLESTGKGVQGMTQKVTCNECGEAFVVGRQDIETIKDGEIEVQYFRCPDCRRPYLVITTDKAMRQLIEKRHILSQTIRHCLCKEIPPQVVPGLHG